LAMHPDSARYFSLVHALFQQTRCLQASLL
jgi:hypothetical protein